MQGQGQASLADVFNGHAHYLNLLIAAKREGYDVDTRVTTECDKLEELLVEFEKEPSNIKRIR